MLRTFISTLIGFALTERIAFSAEGHPKVDLLPDLPREQWVEAFVEVFLHGVAAED